MLETRSAVERSRVLDARQAGQVRAVESQNKQFEKIDPSLTEKREAMQTSVKLFEEGVKKSLPELSTSGIVGGGTGVLALLGDCARTSSVYTLSVMDIRMKLVLGGAWSNLKTGIPAAASKVHQMFVSALKAIPYLFSKFFKKTGGVIKSVGSYAKGLVSKLIGGGTNEDAIASAFLKRSNRFERRS